MNGLEDPLYVTVPPLLSPKPAESPKRGHRDSGSIAEKHPKKHKGEGLQAIRSLLYVHHCAQLHALIADTCHSAPVCAQQVADADLVRGDTTAYAQRRLLACTVCA